MFSYASFIPNPVPVASSVSSITLRAAETVAPKSLVSTEAEQAVHFDHVLENHCVGLVWLATHKRYAEAADESAHGRHYQLLLFRPKLRGVLFHCVDLWLIRDPIMAARGSRRMLDSLLGMSCKILE